MALLIDVAAVISVKLQQGLSDCVCIWNRITEGSAGYLQQFALAGQIKVQLRVKPNQKTPGEADGTSLALGCRQWPVY